MVHHIQDAFQGNTLIQWVREYKYNLGYDNVASQRWGIYSDIMKMVIFLTFVLILSGFVVAETSGNITLTTIVTGLYGSSLTGYCNYTVDCVPGDRCALDYDGASDNSGIWQGNCTSATNTSCLDDYIWRASGYALCYNNNLVTCTSGNWVTTVCSNGCSDAACLTTTTTVSSDSTTTTVGTVATASIEVYTVPDNKEILQNETGTNTLTVKNNGELALYNITMSLSGIPAGWYSVSPEKLTSLAIGSTGTFTISFSIPSDAPVDTYTVTCSIATSNSSVSSSTTFELKVMPSEETVIQQIVPSYQSYLTSLKELVSNITALEAAGVDTTEIWSMYYAIEAKINNTNLSIEAGDYFTANQLLNEVEDDIKALQAKIVESNPPLNIALIAAIVSIAVIAVLVYLFWPVEEQSYKRNWPMKKKLTDRIREKLSRKNRAR